MFDPTDERQRRFKGYGPSKLPSPLDEDLGVFIDQIAAAGPIGVADVLSKVSDTGRQVLLAYAERMASLAVRRRDQGLLLRGIVALVVGGLDRNARESLMVMALVEDSAERIGADLEDTLEAVSKIVGHPGTVNLVLWLTRKPEVRTLESMRYVAGADDDGFRYRLDW